MAIQYGWAEQTPAIRNTLARAPGARSSAPRRRRRKAAAKTVRKAARRAKRAGGKAARFVKGSAAAKRHMAKLRKLAMKARRR